VGGRPKVYVNFSKNFITLTKFIIAGLLCWNFIHSFTLKANFQ
jgi:hypothetical protein